MDPDFFSNHFTYSACSLTHKLHLKKGKLRLETQGHFLRKEKIENGNEHAEYKTLDISF